MNKAMSSKKTVVFGQSWEKGEFICECNDGDFIINEPFDVKKIRNVLCTQWADVVLLNSFQYEDYTFNVYGGGGGGGVTPSERDTLRGCTLTILSKHLSEI